MVKAKKIGMMLCILIMVVSLAGGCQTAGAIEAIPTPALHTPDPKIAKALEAIVSNPKAAVSSNPYDYIKDNKDYEYLLLQGSKTLDYCLDAFSKTNESGLREYIMAIVCEKLLGDTEKDKKWATGAEWYHNYIKNDRMEDKVKLEGAYQTALEAIMSEDPALNQDMKYIAIDSSTLKYLKQEHKEKLLAYFKKYNGNVMDASLLQLEDRGYFNHETMCLDGILLRISHVEIISENKIVFEASKYKSGLGAIGIGYEMEFKDGKWIVGRKLMKWIS